MSIAEVIEPVKRRGLPARLSSKELAEHEFEIVSSTKAKHRRWNSWRHRCSICGRWVCGLLNGRCGGCLHVANGD